MQGIYNTIQEIGRLNIPFFITAETGLLDDLFYQQTDHLRIMEIRCRLSREVYTDEHTALRKELNDALAAARQVLITATEDPRLQFTTSRG